MGFVKRVKSLAIKSIVDSKFFDHIFNRPSISINKYSIKDKRQIRPEKKKYQIKTIAFKPKVTEIPMILNFVPTSSESGFNLTSAIVTFSFRFHIMRKSITKQTFKNRLFPCLSPQALDFWESHAISVIIKVRNQNQNTAQCKQT